MNCLLATKLLSRKFLNCYSLEYENLLEKIQLINYDALEKNSVLEKIFYEFKCVLETF